MLLLAPRGANPLLALAANPRDSKRRPGRSVAYARGVWRPLLLLLRPPDFFVRAADTPGRRWLGEPVDVPPFAPAVRELIWLGIDEQRRACWEANCAPGPVGPGWCSPRAQVWLAELPVPITVPALGASLCRVLLVAKEWDLLAVCAQRGSCGGSEHSLSVCCGLLREIGNPACAPGPSCEAASCNHLANLAGSCA